MADKNSSRKKPTKKAGTQDRSISSSITGPMLAESPAASNGNEVTSESIPTTETWTEAVPLTVKEQKAVLEHLQKGMSPVMACSTAGVSLDSLRVTLAVDARFRRKCGPLPETLTENVRAAVYSKAIKGTVTAQALWLKEEAARKASKRDETPLTPDELLAELDRLSHVLKSLRAEGGSV